MVQRDKTNTNGGQLDSLLWLKRYMCFSYHSSPYQCYSILPSTRVKHLQKPLRFHLSDELQSCVLFLFSLHQFFYQTQLYQTSAFPDPLTL